MYFKPFDCMWDRIEVARQDSDVSLFFDLLLFGEMITKCVASGLVSAIEEGRERHQYGQIYRLVRADGLGEWIAVIDNALTGPASQHLLSEARTEQTELTQKHGPGTWQNEAVSLINRTLSGVDPDCEPMQTKLAVREWFSLFVRLRNKTRGHGATPSNLCTKLCPDLERSIRVLAENLALFRRPWAYLHRNLSGKYRVTNITESESVFDYLKSTRVIDLPDGLYIHFDNPVRVDLIESNVDANDFMFPNGGFDGKRYEMLSYITGNKSDNDATRFLTPASELPSSDTQGIGSLDVQGRCFGNLPSVPNAYVHRQGLETELFNTLMNERHPMITLVGRGGIGKTSLALSVLHRIAQTERFAAIVWFSARDIDLLPEGPKLVKPHVLTEKEIAGEYIRLLDPEEAKEKGFKPLSYFQDSLSKSTIGPLLFVFDNFETVRDPRGLFAWIDAYIRMPNKVLITTRYRDFKGDYYVEVSGMNQVECDELIDLASKDLGVQTLLTDQYRRDVYRESDGHPYVIKILLGEVAKAGKALKVERIVASSDEILDALFERTFSTLTPVAKRVFLTLCNWRSHIPALALEAVLLRPSNEKMNVREAIEDLRRSSFIEILVSESDDEEFLVVPLVASVFGKRKLATSPMKSAIQADTELLYAFGATQPSDIRYGIRPRIERMFRDVARRISLDTTQFPDYLPILEFTARKYPPAWLLLASLHEESATAEALDKTIDALRRYLESGALIADQQATWQRLATLYQRRGDWLGEAHALLELSQVSNAPFKTVSNSANRLNMLFKEQKLMLDTEEKRIVVTRLLQVMENRIGEGDATDCSRLAWLCLHLRDHQTAESYAQRGLSLDPDNEYCLNLIRRVLV